MLNASELLIVFVKSNPDSEVKSLKRGSSNLFSHERQIQVRKNKLKIFEDGAFMRSYLELL